MKIFPTRPNMQTAEGRLTFKKTIEKLLQKFEDGDISLGCLVLDLHDENPYEEGSSEELVYDQRIDYLEAKYSDGYWNVFRGDFHDAIMKELQLD
jgi:hypothetical protein